MEDSDPIAMSSAEEAAGRRVFCPDCGSSMGAEDRFCGRCRWDARNPEQHGGLSLPPSSPRSLGPPSDKSRMTTLLLCVFGGFLGLHRFYVGRAGSGVLWLVSFGLFSVGWIYDLVMVATGEFEDEQGKRVLYWE
jgi:TM2 domain-containing membrane protein YozV